MTSVTRLRASSAVNFSAVPNWMLSAVRRSSRRMSPGTSPIDSSATASSAMRWPVEVSSGSWRSASMSVRSSRRSSRIISTSPDGVRNERSGEPRIAPATTSATCWLDSPYRRAFSRSTLTRISQPVTPAFTRTSVSPGTWRSSATTSLATSRSRSLDSPNTCTASCSAPPPRPPSKLGSPIGIFGMPLRIFSWISCGVCVRSSSSLRYTSVSARPMSK